MIFLNYLYAPHRNSFCSPSSADDNGVINLWLYLGDKAHVRMILQLPAHHATYSICYLNQNAFSCYQERLFWSGKKKKKWSLPNPLSQRTLKGETKRGISCAQEGFGLESEAQSHSPLPTETQILAFFYAAAKKTNTSPPHMLAPLQFRKTYPRWRSLWMHFHHWKTTPKRQRLGQINKLAQNKY